MSPPPQSRYVAVSRRAMLKVTLGASAAALLPAGIACGSGDADVFADAAVDPAATPTVTPIPATPEPPETTTPIADTETPNQEATPTTEPGATVAVEGELVVTFTYTQGAGGKNERPYVAVWVEDAAAELVETVALWYEQGRRGERWLDHLTRWYGRDQDRVAAGGADDAATVSSATRAAGTYAVVWDGLVDGVAAGAGEYFVCIEAAREDGPYSLIREPLVLAGSLAETALSDDGELNNATVHIDG